MINRLPRLRLVLSYLCATSILVAQNAKIVNAYSGKVLDVTGYSLDNGTVIQQYDWLGGLNQQWQIVPLGNGYNEIVNVNSGKVLDVTGYSLDNGTPIQQYQWLAGPNQQWQVVPQDSSFSAIMNLNSGKALDLTFPCADSNGCGIQQWDWLGGLNQQWQIQPAQDAYQTSSQTNIYYDPSSNTMYAVATMDSDYSSSYYYFNNAQVHVSDNGVPVAAGFDSAYGLAWAATGYLYPTAGDYYQADSAFSIQTVYTYQEITGSCIDVYCADWGDPFNYIAAVASEGTDIPVFTTTVWAAPIITIAAVASSLIYAGNNADGVTVPGSRSVFDLKFRSFIPPAWIRGPDTCVDGSGNAKGTIYAGDNRGYDPFTSNYRSHAEGIVSAATGSWQGGIFVGGGANPYFAGGVTTRYASDALASDGYTLASDSILHDCHYTDNIVLEDNSQMFGSVSGGSGAVTANFYGTVNDAASFLGSNTPGLGYNVTFSINTNSNPVSPAYSFDYSHKCYPAYEAYIGSQLIYGYRPVSNSPFVFPFCLAGGLVVTGTAIGAVL